MKKSSILSNLRRTILIIGMVGVSLSVTACGGKKAVETTAATVVETTIAEKDFSMDLEPLSETLSPADLVAYQEDADEVLEKTEIGDNGSIKNTDKSNDELLSEMKIDMESGNLTRDDIEWLCDTQFLGASADYIANAKKELHAICDKLDQAKPTKPAESLSEKPVEKESKPAKPVEKPVSKPVETKPVETKPVETKPVETKPSNSGTTLEGQALIDEMRAAMNTPEHQKLVDDSVIDGPMGGDALTPEEQQGYIQ
ncbi:MAG: hypothetical protein RSB57_02385 [Hungatella sp.]